MYVCVCMCVYVEINNNKHVYHQSHVRKPTGSGFVWAECSLIIRTGCRVQVLSFLAWSSIAQSVCQRAFNLLAIWCRRPQVQILHSTEEDYLSPFDLNIACCARASKLTTNMYVCTYVRTPNMYIASARAQFKINTHRC